MADKRVGKMVNKNKDQAALQQKAQRLKDVI